MVVPSDYFVSTQLQAMAALSLGLWLLLDYDNKLQGTIVGPTQVYEGLSYMLLCYNLLFDLTGGLV